MFWKGKNEKYLLQKYKDSLYEKVQEDLTNDIIDKGVWARAYAKSEGDENKTKALYIEYKVQDLILEGEAINETMEKIARKNEQENRKAAKEKEQESRKKAKEDKYKFYEANHKKSREQAAEEARQRAKDYENGYDYDSEKRDLLIIAGLILTLAFLTFLVGLSSS